MPKGYARHASSNKQRPQGQLVEQVGDRAFVRSVCACVTSLDFRLGEDADRVRVFSSRFLRRHRARQGRTPVRKHGRAYCDGESSWAQDTLNHVARSRVETTLAGASGNRTSGNNC